MKLPLRLTEGRENFKWNSFPFQGVSLALHIFCMCGCCETRTFQLEKEGCHRLKGFPTFYKAQMVTTTTLTLVHKQPEWLTCWSHSPLLLIPDTWKPSSFFLWLSPLYPHSQDCPGLCSSAFHGLSRDTQWPLVPTRAWAALGHPQCCEQEQFQSLWVLINQLCAHKQLPMLLGHFLGMLITKLVQLSCCWQ